MTSLPPGFTTWTLARSERVTRKRTRMRSKRQSWLGVKPRLAAVPKVTRSRTSGSRFKRCDQAKAAIVAKTSRAKTTAAKLGARRGIVIADHDRDRGSRRERGDLRGHQPHPRDLQRSGHPVSLATVALLEHDDAVGEARAAVGDRAELEPRALHHVAVATRQPVDRGPLSTVTSISAGFSAAACLAP